MKLVLVEGDTENPTLHVGSTCCLPLFSPDLAPTSKPPSYNTGAYQPGIQGPRGQLYWEAGHPCLFQRETSSLLSPG